MVAVHLKAMRSHRPKLEYATILLEDVLSHNHRHSLIRKYSSYMIAMQTTYGVDVATQ